LIARPRRGVRLDFGVVEGRGREYDDLDGGRSNWERLEGKLRDQFDKENTALGPNTPYERMSGLLPGESQQQRQIRVEKTKAPGS